MSRERLKAEASKVQSGTCFVNRTSDVTLTPSTLDDPRRHSTAQNTRQSMPEQSQQRGGSLKSFAAILRVRIDGAC